MERDASLYAAVQQKLQHVLFQDAINIVLEYLSSVLDVCLEITRAEDVRRALSEQFMQLDIRRYNLNHTTEMRVYAEQTLYKLQMEKRAAKNVLRTLSAELQCWMHSTKCSPSGSFK